MSSKHAATETQRDALCLRDLFLDGGGEPDLFPTHQSPKGEGGAGISNYDVYGAIEENAKNGYTFVENGSVSRIAPKEISAIVSKLKMSLSQRGLSFLDPGPEATFLNKATWIFYL
jgi:hypothetical protein